MGKYGVLNELSEIGISFPERSEEDDLTEDDLIAIVNFLGWNVDLSQGKDFKWMVGIYKWTGNTLNKTVSSSVRLSRLDALKEAACLVINR